MSAKRRRKFDLKAVPGSVAGRLDDDLHIASPLRKIMNKVFPDHWSFLLGEIALWSFVILLLTGTFLTFFFDPSMEEVVYNGSYV
ncbi:MAG TPA: cytochrome b, partial [Micromonosporaceae bacterium]|nr:cytochrome b [Micromonosporaceae bacterium]